MEQNVDCVQYVACYTGMFFDINVFLVILSHFFLQLNAQKKILTTAELETYLEVQY